MHSFIATPGVWVIADAEFSSRRGSQISIRQFIYFSACANILRVLQLPCSLALALAAASLALPASESSASGARACVAHVGSFSRPCVGFAPHSKHTKHSLWNF